MSGEGWPGQATPRRSSDEDNRPPGYPGPWVGSPYGRAALASAVERIECSAKGGRHHEVFRNAAAMGNLLAGGELYRPLHVEEALMGAAVTIGLSRHDARHQVERGIERGRRTPRQAPTDGLMLRTAGDAREVVAEAMQVAAAAPWTGTADIGRYRTLAAVHLEALRVGKVRVDLSLRSLELVAGVGREAVRKHLRQLEGEWLLVVRRGSPMDPDASTFQVVQRVDTRRHSPTGRAVCPVVDGRVAPVVPNPALPITLPGHAVWADRRTFAWFTYLVMVAADRALTKSEVRAVVGTGAPNTITTTLAYLTDHGLVVEDEDGAWAAVPPEDVGSVEVADLRAAARRQRIKAERANHRRWLAARSMSEAAS